MTITEFVWFSDLMLKLRDKNSAKCKVTLMGIQNKEAVVVKMSTKFLKISLERDIQLKKQNWLIYTRKLKEISRSNYLLLPQTTKTVQGEATNKREQIASTLNFECWDV